jgi:hypothetical protein
MGSGLGAIPNVLGRLQPRATPADAGARPSQAECRRFEPDIPLLKKLNSRRRLQLRRV